jgi:hypothetical protein
MAMNYTELPSHARCAAWQVLGNFITVMRLFSSVRPPSSAAVLELRRQQQGAKGTELQLRRDQVWPQNASSTNLQGCCKEASASPNGCPSVDPAEAARHSWAQGG